jgi:sulfur relay (sulfurtransferase) DsrC/TusE family protein
MLILRSKYKKAKMSLIEKMIIKHICLKLPSEYGQSKSLINLNPKISWHEVRKIFIDKKKELSEVSEGES